MAGANSFNAQNVDFSLFFHLFTLLSQEVTSAHSHWKTQDLLIYLIYHRELNSTQQDLYPDPFVT